MKFDYFQFPPSLSRLKFNNRPLVPLEVYYNSKKASTLALLDSGADYSMLNTQYAEDLGVDLSRCILLENTVGISGPPIKTYLLPELEITIPNFAKLKIPVMFINSNNVNILLGQHGFFDQVKVTFEKYLKSFELKLRK